MTELRAGEAIGFFRGEIGNVVNSAQCGLFERNAHDRMMWAKGIEAALPKEASARHINASGARLGPP